MSIRPKIIKGFSLIEIVVAVGVFSLLAAAVAYTTANSQGSFHNTQDNQVKQLYAQEAYDAVRAIADSSWKSVADVPVNTAYDVRINSAGAWELFNGTTTRSGLRRNVYFYDVTRDSTGNIVSGGSTNDYNTRLATVKIVGGGQIYQLDGYITNFGAYKLRQTAWNGTTGTLGWSGSSLSNNWYKGDNMTGTSTVGALTMVAGSTSAWATSTAAVIAYATSPAIVNHNILTLQWTQNIPTSCILKLYLQATNTGSASPDFTSSSLVGPFTFSSTGTATSSVSLTSYTTIANKKWLRYGVSMRSCSGNYPTLYGVSIYID
jgi:prepilin-type N-terminal cleavage/methylation domain-containing protein